jgi:hypothetical protein
MATPAELREQVRDKRDKAAQARRWAQEMTVDADRDHLLRMAVELEREAADLELQATEVTHVQPPGYSGTQTVQQVQQQQQQQEEKPKRAEDGETPKG